MRRIAVAFVSLQLFGGLVAPANAAAQTRELKIEAAKQLIQFLKGPITAPLFRAQGMEPAR